MVKDAVTAKRQYKQSTVRDSVVSAAKTAGEVIAFKGLTPMDKRKAVSGDQQLANQNAGRAAMAANPNWRSSVPQAGDKTTDVAGLKFNWGKDPRARLRSTVQQLMGVDIDNPTAGDVALAAASVLPVGKVAGLARGAAAAAKGAKVAAEAAKAGEVAAKAAKPMSAAEAEAKAISHMTKLTERARNGAALTAQDMADLKKYSFIVDKPLTQEELRAARSLMTADTYSRERAVLKGAPERLKASPKTPTKTPAERSQNPTAALESKFAKNMEESRGAVSPARKNPAAGVSEPTVAPSGPSAGQVARQRARGTAALEAQGVKGGRPVKARAPKAAEPAAAPKPKAVKPAEAKPVEAKVSRARKPKAETPAKPGTDLVPVKSTSARRASGPVVESGAPRPMSGRQEIAVRKPSGVATREPIDIKTRPVGSGEPKAIGGRTAGPGRRTTGPDVQGGRVFRMPGKAGAIEGTTAKASRADKAKAAGASAKKWVESPRGGAVVGVAGAAGLVGAAQMSGRKSTKVTASQKASAAASDKNAMSRFKQASGSSSKLDKAKIDFGKTGESKFRKGTPRVRQSVIDGFKKRGMAASLAMVKQKKNDPEYLEAIRRYYGTARLNKALNS